jgi:pSer/pThr/pTyr-binding forkhead associated (FHA) protein
VILLGAVALVVLAVAAVLVAWTLSHRPRYKLTLREGADAGLEFPVHEREATVGSADGHTLVISHPRVARLHAVFSREGGDVVVRNRSRDGIRVNGEPVEEAVLRSGDLVTLADSIDLIFTRLG